MYSADQDLQTGLMSNTNSKKTYTSAFPFIKKDSNQNLLDYPEESTAEYQMLNGSETQPSPKNNGPISWTFNDNPKEQSLSNNVNIPKPTNLHNIPQQIPRKEDAMAAHMNVIKMNHERNEMEGCLCFYCGNKVLIPQEATLFKCFFCQRVCDRTRPPVIQKKYLMCGVCRTVIQYTPISNYVRCVCGTVNQIPRVMPQAGPTGPGQV